MTPKEKVEELIQKFEEVELLQDVGGMDIELARQCAMVFAEEITDIFCNLELLEEVRYWEEVMYKLKKM